MKTTHTTRTKAISTATISLSALAVLTMLGVPSTHGALIAHYQLEEGDSEAVDSAGSNDGTFENGAGLQTSDLPQVPSGTSAALELDGTDDHVEIVNAGLLEGLSSLSVAFWSRKDALEDDGSESRFVASDGNNVFQVRESTDELGGKGPGNRIEFRVADSNGDWHGFYSDEEVTELGVWQHVAMTYDGSDLVGYVDGNEVGRTTLGITTNDPDDPTLFGANSDGTAAKDSFLDGGLDEVRFYDHALTQTEIHALAVPEPSTPVLLALGVLTLLRRRRRRRSA